MCECVRVRVCASVGWQKWQKTHNSSTGNKFAYIVRSNARRQSVVACALSTSFYKMLAAKYGAYDDLLATYWNRFVCAFVHWFVVRWHEYGNFNASTRRKKNEKEEKMEKQRLLFSAIPCVALFALFACKFSSILLVRLSTRIHAHIY